MKSLRTYIIDCLESENRAMKKKMLKNKKALKNPQTEEFMVEAEMFVDIYDPARSFLGKGITIEEAFQNAYNNFENECGKIHSVGNFSYRVNVILKGGVILEVPHQHWKQYEWKSE